MDYAFKGGVLFVNVSAIQALALAVLTYYFGVWVKKHVSILEKYSIPSPVVGGILFSIVLSILDGMNIMKVHFDSSLQTLLMLAFYTTIGLMASLKLIKKGGTLLVSFFIAVSVLVVLQNLVGMTIAQAMGLDKHYGILAGSVSMMGGLGTAAAFGPFFEHTYGVTGGTAVGTVVSSYLGQYITLPAYIGSMIVAAIVRNIGDFTHSFSVEGKGLNAVADISLILFVTMAINSLKLYELVNLAIPMIVILAAQTVLMLAFAWLVFIKLFGKEYDNVMLAVGGIGFGMGATVNGLANMQAIGEKYGSSARAWLIVSIVGAFLIDLVNALVITYMGTL